MYYIFICRVHVKLPLKISHVWDCQSTPLKRQNSFAKGGTLEVKGQMPNDDDCQKSVVII